jgi:hypothetical protein
LQLTIAAENKKHSNSALGNGSNSPGNATIEFPQGESEPIEIRRMLNDTLYGGKSTINQNSHVHFLAIP